MDTDLVRFRNARLIRNGKMIIDDLWIQNGKIIDPEPIFFDRKQNASICIDCNQMIIAPGYIDIQINGWLRKFCSNFFFLDEFLTFSLTNFFQKGGFGYDFSTPTNDISHSIENVARNLVRFGVTSFCPTLISQSRKYYQETLRSIKRGPIRNGASVLGVHLEGPFINLKKKGAHDQAMIQNEINSFEQIEQFYDDLSNVSIITLAPELDTNNVIDKLTKCDIVISLGHSNANLGVSEKAFESGAKMITHLFNAMPLFHHRDPGLLGLLTIESDRQVFYSIIADGIHTHYSALKLAFSANPRGMILVSDAVSAAGLQTGTHRIGSQIIEVENNTQAFLAGTNTLCGSIALLDHCVRYLHQKASCSVVEAIECATLHPAQVLDIANQKGSIDFGLDADFIILNDDLEVIATFVSGRCVHFDEKKLTTWIDLSQLLV